MRDFVISTDTAAGLGQEYLSENNIAVHPLHYIIDDVEYGIDLGRELTDKEFYDSIRAGKMPTTSATSPDYIGKLMRRQVNEGFDILHIGFSSGLSSSFEHAAICAEEIMQEVPECKIRAVDTLSAECGQALLVHKAVQMKKQGKTLDEIADWLEVNKHHMVVHFTVEDLFHLVRGGRLSKSTAVLGTALNIQPVLHVDEEGKLANISKVRGRKKAMRALVDPIEANSEGWDKDCIFLSHADALEEINMVKAMIQEKYPDAYIMTLSVSPTVGAHTGAGVLVIAYFGNKK